jgi:deazaflavin-dependent oxidoreductase (nitroreductase family)
MNRVARKRRWSRFASVKLLNPLMRRALERGLVPRGWALLETTGRRSGQPRRVPVGDGLRGGHFWIVAEHGRHADYVRNIEQDPRVRVKVGRRWLTGTAHLLPGDDPLARLRTLQRPWNDIGLRAMASEMLVVRIDLDAAPAPGPGTAAGGSDSGSSQGP